jgi:pimeloyl-ACP methyl ester carboxylesterase
MKESRHDYLNLRGRRCHVRLWGDDGAPRMFMLHGWMDAAATFQFVVDALKGAWQVIAPDWRGFGSSEPNGGAYWFPDYLADLDALLRHYSPLDPVRLLGHSMGGNVAGLYAGVRPERVSKLVLVEGVGLAVVDSSEAPARYRRWLDQVNEPPRERDYADFAELAARLRERNPRLNPAQAEFLAAQLGIAQDSGRIAFAADPWHRAVNPVLYRVEEAKACWRSVEAPVLWIMGAESSIRGQFIGNPVEYRARLDSFRNVREVVVTEAGHNVHHDQPERLAALAEEFFAA